MELKMVDTLDHRLSSLLEKRGARHALTLSTGIMFSSISAYTMGWRLPPTAILCEIAKELNVNELWLMGYNVSKERNPEDGTIKIV
jgi:hypothetical protein